MSRVDDLRRNIDVEIDMAKELSGFVERWELGMEMEKKMFSGIIDSLKKRIQLINNSMLALVSEVSLTKKLPDENRKRVEENVDECKIDEKTKILLKRNDKDSFLKELNINRDLIRKLKKKKIIGEGKVVEYKRPSSYGRLANKIFLGAVETWVRRGSFKSLSLNLRRSNLNFLTTTYVSMMFLTTLLSFLVGTLLFVFFLFFSFGIDFPFVYAYEGGFWLRFSQTFWIILAVPLLTGLAFYFYPGAEKKSLAGKIDQELPFIVIHMASISGSGIEPSEIFKIVGLSKEYKYMRKEIRKVLNQINVYGYDLTNALRNVALATPSSKLAELLNGIGITINSGGSIKLFFQKRAESLLLDYRLEREKFTKTAEAFMDIYISLVIAAPMILLLLLIMISVSGIQTGFSLDQLTIALIGIVAIINVIFLTFLHLKQPTY